MMHVLLSDHFGLLNNMRINYPDPIKKINDYFGIDVTINKYKNSVSERKSGIHNTRMFLRMATMSILRNNYGLNDSTIAIKMNCGRSNVNLQISKFEQIKDYNQQLLSLYKISLSVLASNRN
jgi:hypothetical protein